MPRLNSRWNLRSPRRRSGWRLDVGLSGIQLDADTLAQMFTGGIEVATPTEPEKNVGTGHRFKLYDKPDKEWAQWKPSLAHGEALNRIASKMPQPIRLAMRWQERSFGFRKNQQRAGWCLPLDDGRVLCLSEQISAPSSAIPNSIQFELAGLTLNADQLSQPSGPVSPESIASSTTRFSIAESLPADTTRWPVNMVSSKLPDQVCDVFLAHPDAASVLAIDAARLSVRDSAWMIDEMVTMGMDYHGLPVVSAATSQVIGFLSIQKNTRVILAP